VEIENENSKFYSPPHWAFAVIGGNLGRGVQERNYWFRGLVSFAEIILQGGSGPREALDAAESVNLQREERSRELDKVTTSQKRQII